MTRQRPLFFDQIVESTRIIFDSRLTVPGQLQGLVRFRFRNCVQTYESNFYSKARFSSEGFGASSSALSQNRKTTAAVHVAAVARFLDFDTAGFFENYDTALLSLALKQIQHGLDIAEVHLGAMLSAIRLGYLASFIISPLADVFGRRRLLLYTIVGYTVFTGLSAIAPHQRFTFRATRPERC